MATVAVKIKPCRHAAAAAHRGSVSDVTCSQGWREASVYDLKVEESKDCPEIWPFGCEMIERTAAFNFASLVKSLYTQMQSDLWTAPLIQSIDHLLEQCPFVLLLRYYHHLMLLWLCVVQHCKITAFILTLFLTVFHQSLFCISRPPLPTTVVVLLEVHTLIPG